MSETIKAGWKTSEFWLSLAAMAVSSVYASGLIADDTVWAKGIGIVATVLAALGYSVSRGLAKKTP